jgi:hypothetical protein
MWMSQSIHFRRFINWIAKKKEFIFPPKTLTPTPNLHVHRTIRLHLFLRTLIPVSDMYEIKWLHGKVLQKLIVVQLVNKLPAFYGTRRLIAVFTAWMGDLSVSRPLPTQDSTTQRNADIHPCLERDLDCAATGIDFINHHIIIILNIITSCL